VDLNFHGSDEQIESYVLGRMSDLDIPVLEEHLLVCSGCRERLDSMEQFVVGMRELHRAEPAFANPVTPRSDWFAWLRRPAFSMVLAVVALAAIIGVFAGGRTKFAPVATLELTAIRGDVPVAGPARELDLKLSDAPQNGGPFRVEVVDATGHAVWQGVGETSAAGVQVRAQHLGTGQYFVRLYAASGQLLHEYGFKIRAS
jgi:predicted anti-sigma-YlaC factor YlaD